MRNNEHIQLGDLIELSAALESIDLPETTGVVVSIKTNSILVRRKSNDQEINLLSLGKDLFPLPVMRNGVWGYADTKGLIITPLIFTSATPFNNGVAMVSLTEKRDPFYINTKGEWVSERVDPQDGDMIIYVLQSEGRADRDECETILGIFRDFETAASYLGEHRSMYQELSLFDDDTPVFYDQVNCYWDSFHYLTIRERTVPRVKRGEFIYSLNMTIKSNVIDVPSASSFFSNRTDLLKALDSALSDCDSLTGMAHLDEREAVSESKLYSIGVFVLQ